MRKPALILFAASFLFSANQILGQWTKAEGNLKNASVFAVNGDTIFAGAGDSIGYGVFVSRDNGHSWAKNSLSVFGGATSIVVSNNNVFVGSARGLFVSKNNGGSWDTIGSRWVTNLAAIGGSIVATIINFPVVKAVRYANSGSSWTPVDSGIPDSSKGITSLTVTGGVVFASCLGGGVYRSIDSGASWNPADSGLPDSVTILTLAASGNTVFAGCCKGAYLSKDAGKSWTKTGLTNGCVDAFAVSGSAVFAGCTGNGIFLSVNEGISWTQSDSGLPDTTQTSILALAKSGDFLVAGVIGQYVWHRPLSEMVPVLSIKKPASPFQTRLRVSANGSLHSGPTFICTVASRCSARLGIFSTSGKKVASWNLGERSPGEFSITPAGDRFPAGLYEIRFQAGSYRQSDRLIIIK